MAFPNITQPNHFKTPAATGSFNHDHATQMAHAAQRRLAVAKALSGGPKVPGGPVAMPKVPGSSLGSIGAPPAAPPPQGSSFKATVAHAMAAHGVPVAVHHVNNAIDSLTAKGAFTPFQGAALKQHTGPLIGPQGQQTMSAIANEIHTNPKVRMG